MKVALVVAALCAVVAVSHAQLLYDLGGIDDGLLGPGIGGLGLAGAHAGPARSRIYRTQLDGPLGLHNAYNFGYDVSDPGKGDVYGQKETRGPGGVVKGVYYVQQKDGRVRKVEYEADAKGFRAAVSGVPREQGGGYHGI